MTNPLESLVRNDTHIMEDVAKHPSIRNVDLGIQLITDMGVNTITNLE